MYYVFENVLYSVYVGMRTLDCKTVRPMPSDRCLSLCPSLCEVRALWPKGWMDQGETWHAGRPRPRTHCVRWGPSSPSPIGAQPSIFGAYLLWPNGCMGQDATWYRGRPRLRRHCVRWGSSPSPQEKRKGGSSPHFKAHVSCGQTA